MARAKRKPKKKTKLVQKDDIEGDSPDPESEEFFNDDVDKFHSNREKVLLDKSSQSSDEEMEGFEQLEEVLGLDLESDNEDEDDIENLEGGSSSDEDIEKGIPSEKAWGKKKKVYYDADQSREKDLDSEEEEALDKEEEEEALMLQQNMAARLDENDFDIDSFELLTGDVGETAKSKEVEKAKQEKIIMDLSKLSKEEKIKLLAKDSPELFELLEDLKEKLADVTGCLFPLVQMARSGKITNPQGVEYLEMKHQLIMNYLVNVSFYLLLRAHQTPVKNHPVIERLVQYRELIKQLEPLDDKLRSDMEYFLSRYKNSLQEERQNDSSEPKENESNNVDKKKISKKRVKFEKAETASEVLNDAVVLNGLVSKKRKKLEDLDPLSYYEAIRDMKRKRKEERRKAHEMSMREDVDNIDIEDEGDAEGKRGITYQISKNKGLTPKRKKEVRNPRLKHRKKFVKAKIKRKSKVNPVVKEITRYGGESTGIKTHLTRGIKIK
ncbi:something about silencing protein 10-like [Dendronephthya gigantea]|uniref:something about silencing protein 10-like n=1 Tax=Dendronephthya gigantea TaxID=151771 RepID=UPI0010699437|nr:something about silencing protein 10-like [Dendronephthya gigantea]